MLIVVETCAKPTPGVTRVPAQETKLPYSYSVRAGTFEALREREFRLLWTGHLLSSAGSSLFPVALIFAVLDLGERSDLGLALAALIVPNLLLSLVGGVWADRLARQRVMLVADMVRAGAQTVGAIQLISGRAELWHLIALAAVYGAANAFFVPAANGLVPETVSAVHLQQANALMSLARRSMTVFGPVVSSGLFEAVGPGWIYGFDAVTFFASAGFLAAMTPTRRDLGREPFVTALVHGWREVRSRTWIWASIACFSVWNMIFAPFYVLGPVIARRELGGEVPWGFVLTLTAIGYVIGGAVALHFRPARPLFVGYLLTSTYAVPLLLLAQPSSVILIGLGTAVGAASLEIANTLWYTALHRRVPGEALSRVMSYDALGSLLFLPLGYLLTGPIAAAIGERATLLGAASLLWLSAVAVAGIPAVRNLRDDKPPAQQVAEPERETAAVD